MKHIKSINEIFGLEKFFNKDEDIAIEILNQLNNNDIDIQKEIILSTDSSITTIEFKFKIDDFEIKLLSETTGPLSLSLIREIKIDDAKIMVSNNIFDKILNKLKEDKDEIYTKKDFRTHFKLKNEAHKINK